MIVMLGTSLRTRGGVSAVIEVYQRAGLFERWPIVHVETHVDGSLFKKLRCAINAYIKFIGLLALQEVRLVHVHGSSRGSFWRKSVFLLPIFLMRRTVVFHLHGGEFQHFYSDECGPLARAWIRQIFRRVTQVVVLSQERLAWIKRIAPAARVTVLPNPVWCPEREYLVAQPGSPTLIFLGALLEEKGVFDLLHAAHLLLSEFPTLRLIFLGSGLAEARLVTEAEHLGISSQVEFRGWVTGVAKAQALAQAGVFVLPSYFEAMPMSLMEAMALGLPVVATRVGAIPEIVSDFREGRLHDPRDTAGLTAAIADVLRDPQAARAMGLAARAKIEELYGAKKITAELESMYCRLGAGTAGVELAG